MTEIPRTRRMREESDMKKGLLIVISGPSGSGKGTVNEILKKTPGYAFSVSATTRKPREGEVDGVNYYYITKEAFEARIAKGEMLEYTCYCENYYGTPLKETEETIAAGKNLILEIEVEGALNVKRLYPDALLIMILPSSYEELEARLRGRGTEPDEVIRCRLARAREEVALLPNYDYVVYNRDGGVEACVEEIRNIVNAEKNAVARQEDPVSSWLSEKA